MCKIYVVNVKLLAQNKRNYSAQIPLMEIINICMRNNWNTITTYGRQYINAAIINYDKLLKYTAMIIGFQEYL